MRRSSQACVSARGAVVLIVALGGGAIGGGDRAASAASPREIKASIDAAEDVLSEGRGDAAVPHLTEAVRGLEEALAADRVPSSLRLLARRCTALRQKLEQAGVDVAGISVPAATGQKMPPGEPKASPAAMPAAAAGVSFSKDIAPLLVRSCGGCHVNGKKGEFHIPSYAALMQSGAVQPGVGQASRIVEVIASGDMPRGGGKVAAGDLAALVRWIDMGARYDAGDPTLPLAAVGGRPQPGGKGAAPPANAMAIASLKPGEVSFAIDVAPVLIESCLPCHGGLETESGFSVAAFPRLLGGGGSGVAVQPGQSADSLLVKKIRGTGIDGQRMPLGKPPLSSDVIARIAKWIDEGARLDVAAAGGDVRTIAATGRAMHLSDEDLAAVRRDAAREYWRRFLPDEDPQVVNRDGLTVIGNLPRARVEMIASLAEAAWSDLAKRLAPEKNQPRGTGGSPVKGGIVLYAFAKSYDFSEFWLVRHGTDRPRDITSTAGISGDVVYAALQVSDSLLDGADATQSDLSFTIAKQLGAAVFLVRGAPSWFAEGAGRVLAADLVPKAPLARASHGDLPGAIGKINAPEDVFAGRADPQATATVAAAFVDRLTSSGAKLPALLATLDAGTGFEEAFQATFRKAAGPLLEAWLTQEASRNRRR